MAERRMFAKTIIDLIDKRINVEDIAAVNTSPLLSSIHEGR